MSSQFDPSNPTYVSPGGSQSINLRGYTSKNMQKQDEWERHTAPQNQKGVNQFIELTSSRRDRMNYPDPAKFTIDISQSGTKNTGKTSMDPVSKASAEKIWVSSAFNTRKLSPVAPFTRGKQSGLICVELSTAPGTTTPEARLGNATGTIILEINTKDLSGAQNTSGVGSLQLAENYYRGAIMALIDSAAAFNPDTFAVGDFDTSANNRRRIIDYKYLGDDRAEFTVTSGFSTALVPGTTRFVIIDPTDLSGETGRATSNYRDPLFFVPCSPSANNYYVNSILYNQTQCESRPIKDFDRDTHLLSINTSGSLASTANSGPVDNWLLGDTYSIRREKPVLDCERLDYNAGAGVTAADLNPLNYNNFSFNLPLNRAQLITDENSLLGAYLEILFTEFDAVTLAGVVNNFTVTLPSITEIASSTVVTDFNDYFNGSEMRMISGGAIGQIESVIDYNRAPARQAILGTDFIEPNTKQPIKQELKGFNPIATAGADIQFSAPQTSRRIVRYVNWGVFTPIFPTLNSTANNVIYFGNTGNSFDQHPIQKSGYYNNLFISIMAGPAAGEIRLIKSYGQLPHPTNPGQLVWGAEVYVPFSVFLTTASQFRISSGTVSPSFKHCLINQTFLILQWSYDNRFPLINGLTSKNVASENLLYEIELINLILPNQILNNGKGSLISFYQYVYVELQNAMGTTTSNPANLLISNNPNAQAMTFRAAIDDVPNPVNSSFIKIDGDGMVQTIKFNPRDSMSFAVIFPDGTLFKTIIAENYAPQEPNPLIQISAMFRIKRLGRDEGGIVFSAH